MIKRALKGAVGVSVGVALGGVILPRLLYRERYNGTYPPVLWHALLALAASCAAAFLVCLLIEWVRAKLKKEA